MSDNQKAERRVEQLVIKACKRESRENELKNAFSLFDPKIMLQNSACKSLD